MVEPTSVDVLGAPPRPWSAPGHGPRADLGVVVLHGFTGHTGGTRALGERLAAEGYAVDVPLLPGHGTSSRELARTSYADWRAAAQRSVAGLARGRAGVVVVGLSMGGTLALDLAGHAEPGILGIVPINALVLGREGLLARLAPLLQHVLPYVPRDAAGMPTDDILRPGVSEDAYRWVPARAANSLLAALPEVRAGLARIERPVLVVGSRTDRTVDPANADAIAAALTSAPVERLVCERSSHVVLLDHDADLVAERVIRFVAAVTGA